MEITLREITSPNIWENFLLKLPKTPFFQSWWWGEVQKKCGHGVIRWALSENKKIVGIVQTIKVAAKRGTFLWIRHGPLLKVWQWQWFDIIISRLKKIGQEAGASFIRLAPLIDDWEDNRREFKVRGFRNAPIHNVDAENTWVIDLNKGEDELLSQMRKTTRYLVRKAQSIGVTVEKTTQAGKIKHFLELYYQTARRQRFIPHQGIAEEFAILGKKNLLQLFLASYQGRLTAAALIVFYGNEAVYHHSAMQDNMRQIPSSYLIQWEAIKEAKRRGLARYNLWGVAPLCKPHHPWQGLTLFKTGFGGHQLNHIHAQDLPLSFKYWLTWAVETGRRIKRGY